MPAYKEENGTWTSKFKYKNWIGERQQKTKRGFARKKDADDFEREFKSKFVHSANIPFDSLVDRYLEAFQQNEDTDVTTYVRKKRTFEAMITPYFKKKPVNEIDELDVLNWQTWIKQKGYDKFPDVGYAPTYLKSINNELSAILNFGCRYYKLPYNVCQKAGSMGKMDADTMQIWTLDQFEQFIGYVDKSAAKIAFDVLFWTGIREGELLALTLNDFLPSLKLNIDKNFAVVEGEHIIKDPKNEWSVRCIAIPQFLYDEVMAYADSLYGLSKTDRLFMFTKSFLLKEIKRVAKKADLEPIRIHDLRHSHASLLIEMGFNILMISERLGHKNVQTTWNTYAHLYPDKGKQIAFGLQEVKVTGITSNQTAEDQVIGLLGQIQKMLPNYNTYQTDDIILWDSAKKEKSIVDREVFDSMVTGDIEPAEAFVIMIQNGFYEASKQIIFCFSSRGMPIQYL
ncbi:MAG: tyrosine-type recombinase/integrase [Lachnospiraceae bacterium]|nr:tyrosine-type recombinase/integrase [Lachnospiraceae bacterium]